MIETRRPSVSRAVQMINHPIPKGVDITSKDPAIPPGKCRSLKNVKVEDGRVTSMGINTTEMPASDLDLTFWSVQLISGGVSWGIYRNGTEAIAVNLSSGNDYSVKDSGGTDDFDFTSYPKVQAYSDGFIAFGDQPGAVYSYWDGSKWLTRIFGLESPKINGGTAVAEIGTPGTYQYGIEFLVLEDGIVTRSSGVSRRTITGEIFQPIVRTGALPAAEIYVERPADTASWTHLALWRSKNLEEVDGFIAGNQATLYQIVRYAKGSLVTVEYTPGLYRYELPYDGRSDTLLPGDPSFVDVVPTTPEVLELEPANNFLVYGYVANSKLVMGGLTSDPFGIYFSAARYSSRYEEQFSAADRISVSSQYGFIKGIYGLADDLIIASQNQFFRCINADFESPIYPLGSPGMIQYGDAIKVIEGFGVLCIPADKVLRYMDMNFQWKDEVGQRNADGLQNAFSDFTPGTDRLLATYSRGVLSVGVTLDPTHYVLVPGQGWTQRQVDSTGEAVLWDLWDSGAGEAHSLVRNATLDTAHLIKFSDTVPTAQDYISQSEIILGPFQANMVGDGIVEFMEFQIEGSFSDLYPTLTVLDGTGTELDYTWNLVSVENSGDLKSRTHTYKVTDASPGISRPVAQRLFVKISTVETQFTMNAFRFKGIFQQGGQAPARLQGIVEANNMALQISFQNSLVMRFTRPDPETDFYGNGDLTES